MTQRERNLKKRKLEVPVLGRKESQAQTRARLIAVGREHFVRFGMGGASVAKIAAEAGFTRGALYANFQNLEELFVAVLKSGSDMELLTFQSILASTRSAQERFQMLREAIGARMQDPAWIVLQAEFQANALRSAMIREAFLEQQARRRRDGAALLREFTSQMGLVLSASPEEIVALLGSLSEGLAVRQAVSGVLELEQARALSLLCFDRLVTWGLPGQHPVQ
ncbi:MAG: regulatory protein TetR [Acidobacteriaceae bacterium]|nr:regulatory protein TetR [Acidobacteriaceae bacterium]